MTIGLSASPLVEVGYVLVVERRICRNCGHYFDAPSPNLHTYAVAPRGYPPARSIQRIPNMGPHPGLRKTVFMKEIMVPACACCWEEEVPFLALAAEPPPPPPVRQPAEPPIQVRVVPSFPRLEDL